MLRTTLCSSSGESIVSIQPLPPGYNPIAVNKYYYIIICHSVSVTVSCAGRKGTSDLHMKRSPTQSGIYQTLYWYNWLSWWWARGCSKHVQNWNKHIEENCASNWSLPMNHNRIYGKKYIKNETFIVVSVSTSCWNIGIMPKINFKRSLTTHWEIRYDIWTSKCTYYTRRIPATCFGHSCGHR